MLKTLLKQVKQYKAAAIMTPIWTALEVVMGVLIPYVTASIIDKGIMAGDIHAVLLYGGIMVVMAMFSLFFGIRAGMSAAYSSSGFAANLREAMYTNIQRFSFSDIDKFSTAGLVTRMTTDVANVQQAFQMLLRISVRAPLNLVFGIIMCLFINARMGLIFVVALVFLSISFFLIIRRAMSLFAELMRKYDELNSVVRENVAGIRVVKSFVREKHESLRFRAAVDLIYRLNFTAEVLVNLNGPVMNLAIYGSMIAMSWFGARYIVAGELTTGQLTSLFTYEMTILMALMMLSMIFIMLSQSIASGKRIAEVIDEIPDMSDPAEPLTSLEDGSIDFENVSFSYSEGGEPVLKDISLHIDSGQVIGIIGATGCGKSSLVNLISRLYDVTGGCVKVGGRDVREYALDSLRSQVAVVLQKNTLFSGTILENLRWGNENATMEQCRDACEMAQASEFVEAFPDGYDTKIDQGGTNVSGGQRQRLCIARALLRKPKILILDDSTSAVDTGTDARIREMLATKIPGMTRIIISQRILSIKDADRIIVMNDGAVSGFDTHDNLLKDNEIYKDIYEMQTSGGEADFDKS